MTRLQKFINQIVWFWASITWKDKFIGTALRDWLVDAYIRFVVGVLQRLEQDWIGKLKPILDKAEATGKVPPEVQPLLDEILKPSAPIAAALGTMVGTTATGSLVGSTIGPFLMLLQYEMQRDAKQARWDPATGLAVVYRRPDKEMLVNSDLRDQGWTDERISLLKDVARTRLVEDLCVELRRRGVYNESTYLESMRWLGYEAKEAQDYYRARENWPGVSDLVRMAVREAFTPEIAERFGQYQDLPPQFMEKAKQIGLPEEFARAYWAAHWDLPSAQLGFEMLHRGIISQDELKLLLRALDIMPFWRDKLINLSFVPFTRVDIRRMHKMGILTKAQVTQAYLDIGYSPEKASALTDFTIKLNTDTATAKEKDLTKAEMVTAYKKRIITEDELREWLKDEDYSTDEIEIIIETATTAADTATRDLTLSQVRELYQHKLRSKLEITTFLVAFGYDAEGIEALYDLWDWEKPLEVKQLENHLALSQLGQLYTNKTLARDKVFPYLVAMGYPAIEISYIFDLWDYNKPLPVKIIERNLSLSQIKELFQHGLRIPNELTPMLLAMGYSASESTTLYELWRFVKPEKQARPTRGQLDSFLVEGIIDLQTWSDEYSVLGYDGKYQEWYFAYLVEKGKIEV